MSSIGLDAKKANDIEIQSQSESGMGLASWMFQLSELRAETGVYCGIEDEIVRHYFPNVNRWIKETVTSTPIRENMPKRFDPLHSLVTSRRTPGEALEEFYMLEGASAKFGIEISTLTRIRLNDSGVTADISPAKEMEARVILGDRNGSLQLFANDTNFAETWLKHPKNIHQGDPFPFTVDEITKLEESLGDGCYEILRTCMSHMTEYPPKSRVKMVRILTKYGKQGDLEKIWNDVGPIGSNVLGSLIEEIYQWRENREIHDFWGLLGRVQGREENQGDQIPPNQHFRRRICLQIVSKSWKNSDLQGIVEYIPDLLTSSDHYDVDWTILENSEKNPKMILSRINRLQPREDKIQRRLELYIEKKMAKKEIWKIGYFIPEGKKDLLDDYKWICPLLRKIKEKEIYHYRQPIDGLSWVAKLSESEYLECLEDSLLQELIAIPKTLTTNSPRGWKDPKAISTKLPADSDSWVKRKEWARLVCAPSLREKLRYQKDKAIQLLLLGSLLATILFVFAPITLLNTIEGASLASYLFAGLSIIIAFYVELFRSGNHKTLFAGNGLDIFLISLQIVLSLILSIVAITEIKSLDLSFTSPGNLVIREFAGVEVLIPDNLLLIGAMVVVFSQISREMWELHERMRTEKHDFFKSIGIRV
jgi:hypothetical protein